MSLRRLLCTTGGMAAAAVALAAGTPDLRWLATGAGLQEAVDAAGAETALLTLVAVLAWLAWGWGVLGLGLTALSAAPGAVGALGRLLGRLLLPATARQAAALALGLGLGAPVLAGCTAPPATEVSVAAADLPAPAPAAVPDWPASMAGAPDWPAAAAGEHVVVRGDCLWDLAATWLRDRTGAEPGPAEIAAAVDTWWRANADVIGPDPDLLHPGQVLRAPP
ncbi:LysM peptidoglycan-binding domain-containing protein [Blastococcus sp. SYSU D00820]